MLRLICSLSRLRTAGFIVAAGLAALLSSCTSGLYPLDSPTLQARGLQAGEGYIVGTFHYKVINRKGEPGSRGANSTVSIRGTSGGAKGKYVGLVPHVMPVSRDPYLMGGGQSSEEIAIPVPAGSYEITGWTMTGSGSSGPVTVMNRKPIKVPFEVKPGEATYVGSYHALAITGRNLLGFPVFAEGLILAKDDLAGDQGKIVKKYPSLKRVPIKNSGAAAGYMIEMKHLAETPRFLGIW
jgi:hypothetical protein